MKKALTGPRRSAKKQRAERRGIVAARRRRNRESPGARLRKWTRRVDRRVDRAFTRAEPELVRWAHRARLGWRRWSRRAARLLAPLYRLLARILRWTGRRLRPVGVLVLRLLGAAERATRRALAAASRGSTRAARVLTPERGACVLIVAASLCLLVAQFVDYREIEAGQPGYAGLGSIAAAPVVESEPATSAHSYALVPVALLGVGIGLFALMRGRRKLGRVVFLLGALTAAVVLIVDLPAGLDLSGQASRFAGAEAVLAGGFYGQLAAAAGMMIGGLLLGFAPSVSRLPKSKRSRSSLKTKRARKPSLGRTQGGAVRERTSPVRERTSRA